MKRTLQAVQRMVAVVTRHGVKLYPGETRLEWALRFKESHILDNGKWVSRPTRGGGFVG